MSRFAKITVLGLFVLGVIAREAPAQIRFPQTTPANSGNFQHHHSMGFNPGFSPWNPWNPRSPFSPYNPFSPLSPFSPTNPFNNPYAAYNYAYNPAIAYGLYSPNPYVRARSWAAYDSLAVYNNVAWYNSYYNTALYNTYASNYNTQVYNNYASALNTYQSVYNAATSAALTTAAIYNNAYNTMAAANNNVYNPYAMASGGNPGRYSGSFSGGPVTNPYPPPTAGVVPQYSPPPGPSAGEMEMMAKIDILKSELYAKNNPPPTPLANQAKAMGQRLKKMQSFASASEISSGSAVNVLLDDIRKRPGKKPTMDPIPIGEDVLKSINVIQNAGNLGLIRDEGKFAWPVAFVDILSADERKFIEQTTRFVVASAFRDSLDVKALRDLRNLLDGAKERLSEKVNDISTNEYLDARRFLSDFEDARIALERNEAVHYAQFQKFIVGGKGAQELVDYMVAKGLKFASATPRDEGAYRALYSAIAALNIGYNAQFPLEINIGKE